MRIWKKLGLGLAAVVPAACGGSPEVTTSPTQSSGALAALPTCGDVEAALRKAALTEMERQLDEAYQQFVSYGSYCYGSDDSASPTASSSGGSGGGKSAPNESGAKQTSTTNNQVAGVDEADFVKNDNEYIYVVSDGALRIIDAWPAPEAHEIANVPIAGTPKKLFVANDRALVYSSISKDGTDPNDPYGYYGGGECTYGYDCDFSGDGTATRISVFDLSDRANPTLLREVDLSGAYINSRRVGSAVYSVVHEARTNFEGVQYWPEGISMCGGQTNWVVAAVAFAKLRAKNAQIIESAPLGDWLPSVTDTHYAGGSAEASTNLLGDCEGFYNSPLGDGSGFITLIAMSLEDDATLNSSTIVSRPGAVYASSDSLYVAMRQSADSGYGWYSGMDSESSATTVHKFSLANSPARVEYAASGVVKGAVLNQFSMDDWQSHLRIATTSGHVPDPNVHSTMTILEQRGARLVETGRVDQIAPTEDIRSVRFSEDKAFVVTFKKTDPLYVFDLSDAKNPRILGELKIPGFSTYMHMMDDTHLLTIGYDADDQGSFAWFQGVLLQIFDVSDPTHPTQLHEESIGTRGSSSEALTNHLAFNYFAPMNLLSFPITVCEGGSSGSYGTTMTFSGLKVYDVTTTGGFSLRGEVAHPSDPTSGTYDNAACSNWWTQASSQVKRSIIMDDYVFSISESLIKVNSLSALSTDVVSIPIAD